MVDGNILTNQGLNYCVPGGIR